MASRGKQGTPDQVRAFLAYLDQGLNVTQAAVKAGMSPRWGYNQIKKRNQGSIKHERPTDRHLRYRYGITGADYDRMFQEQGGGCAICGDPPPAGKPLHIDHSHARGHVRRLLCGQCNRGLGHFKHDPELLRKAMVYIVQYGA